MFGRKQHQLWERHLVTDEELSFYCPNLERTVRYRVRAWEAGDLPPVVLVTQGPEATDAPCTYAASRIAGQVWMKVLPVPFRTTASMILFFGERGPKGEWRFFLADITWMGRCRLRRVPMRVNPEVTDRSTVEVSTGCGFECP